MKCSERTVLFPKIVQGERSYASREGQDGKAAPGVRAARQPARGVIWRAIPGAEADRRATARVHLARVRARAALAMPRACVLCRSLH